MSRRNRKIRKTALQLDSAAWGLLGERSGPALTGHCPQSLQQDLRSLTHGGACRSCPVRRGPRRVCSCLGSMTPLRGRFLGSDLSEQALRGNPDTHQRAGSWLDLGTCAASLGVTQGTARLFSLEQTMRRLRGRGLVLPFPSPPSSTGSRAQVSSVCEALECPGRGCCWDGVSLGIWHISFLCAFLLAQGP